MAYDFKVGDICYIVCKDNFYSNVINKKWTKAKVTSIKETFLSIKYHQTTLSRKYIKVTSIKNNVSYEGTLDPLGRSYRFWFDNSEFVIMSLNDVKKVMELKLK